MAAEILAMAQMLKNHSQKTFASRGVVDPMASIANPNFVSHPHSCVEPKIKTAAVLGGSNCTPPWKRYRSCCCDLIVAPTTKNQATAVPCEEVITVARVEMDGLATLSSDAAATHNVLAVALFFDVHGCEVEATVEELATAPMANLQRVAAGFVTHDQVTARHTQLRDSAIRRISGSRRCSCVLSWNECCDYTLQEERICTCSRASFQCSGCPQQTSSDVDELETEGRMGGKDDDLEPSIQQPLGH
ncbi:hypothetical protein ACH5RR_013104 [Cinchona calisaya]|uniref:Uncharacterized protein n=1 Tax=Cinchona calisaya TaxID=153742 RepID=A0ABD3A2R0_9GENT